jgi:AcrR family transcriptional regulator
MAPDERRRAIVEVVVPLLLENGDDVSTRQIAEAAGIAEGTIFRVFPDKAALLLAAAEEVLNPRGGRAELAEAVAGIDDLREKLLVVTDRMNARSERLMVVMMALRRLVMSQPPDKRHEHKPGPPAFLADAQKQLHQRLTEMFEPHRDELSVEPATAALLLRTLVLGSRHPGADTDHRLTREQIVDSLLDGVRRRPDNRTRTHPSEKQGD